LIVYGGEIVLEGVRVQGIDNNREAIKNGTQYLLFLKEGRGGRSGHYEIYYGGIFEVLNGQKVDPLLKAADRVFESAAGTSLKEMIARIQGAKPIR
jgi:hypothetical protein